MSQTHPIYPADPETTSGADLDDTLLTASGPHMEPGPAVSVLVITGPGLPAGWPQVVGTPRRGNARFLPNCHTPEGQSAAALLLAGDLPAGSTIWTHPAELAVPHLGHRLAGTHRRVAIVESGDNQPGAVGSGFAEGFDEVVTLGVGEAEPDPLRIAARRIIDHRRTRRLLPWFIFVYLAESHRARDWLGRLIEIALRTRTVLLVLDDRGEPRPLTRRTPLWLEFPSADRTVNLDQAASPRFCSPLDCLPTLLYRLRRDETPQIGTRLDVRRLGFPSGLMAATLPAAAGGAGDQDPERMVLDLAVGPTSEPADRSGSEPITFVAAVNDPDELHQNLLLRPLDHHDSHQWLLIDNTSNRYTDITRLYNDAYEQAENDLMIFCHQDVLLPPGWESRFFAAVADLERRDPDWGVIGSAGVLPLGDATLLSSGRRVRLPRGHWADPGGYKYIGPLPQEVLCLDEMWLGVRRSSGIRFDPELPGFHCYGIDLSLTALAAGKRSYALDSFVWHKHRDRDGEIITRPDHSTKIVDRRSDSFRATYLRSHSYVAEKWSRFLPFASTSSVWDENGNPLSED